MTISVHDARMSEPGDAGVCQRERRVVDIVVGGSARCVEIVSERRVASRVLTASAKVAGDGSGSGLELAGRSLAARIGA